MRFYPHLEPLPVGEEAWRFAVNHSIEMRSRISTPDAECFADASDVPWIHVMRKLIFPKPFGTQYFGGMCGQLLGLAIIERLTEKAELIHVKCRDCAAQPRVVNTDERDRLAPHATFLERFAHRSLGWRFSNGKAATRHRPFLVIGATDQ